MSTSMKDLLEAGVHFGHQTQRWNPKMDKYIYGAKSGIHILDLRITYEAIEQAQDYVQKLVANSGKVLFVGTKPQAQQVIEDQANRAGMPYVNFRWLGGMLTNYKTVRSSIRRLEILNAQEEEGKFADLTKKEVLGIRREMEKLDRSIGGIKNIGGLPEALFVVDVENEKIAIAEAKKMGIPIIGIVDTNSNPDDVDFIIPGNDDAIRSISLISRIISNACLEGAEMSGATRTSKDGPVVVKKASQEDQEVQTEISNQEETNKSEEE